MVTDYLQDFHSGGDLWRLLSKKGRFDEALTRFYTIEIVSGLKYLNSQGIVHCDIKPENIILDREGHIIITDFGLAKKFTSPKQTCDRSWGTTRYMAPEVILGRPYRFEPDWWSLGIMIFEMLIGRVSVPTSNESSFLII